MSPSAVSGTVNETLLLPGVVELLSLSMLQEMIEITTAIIIIYFSNKCISLNLIRSVSIFKMKSQESIPFCYT